MIPAAALVIAFLLDRWLGEPPNALHPVAWMGTLIGWGRAWALAARPMGQLLRGAIVALLVPCVAAFVAWELLHLVSSSILGSLVVMALLLKPLFAVRALGRAAFVVRDALVVGDLPGAREGLRSLCSRDPSSLDAHELAAAAVESVAENASDSIVAPLFFFTLFGLPGAAAYRACNTLDAMMGYHGELEWAGKVAARLDDVLNLIPARLTTLLLLLSALFRGGDLKRGVFVLLRDSHKTESPNAGRPMATMAGLLGVQLVKKGHYALGDPLRQVGPQDITRAWALISMASWCIVALFASLLAGGALAAYFTGHTTLLGAFHA